MKQGNFLCTKSRDQNSEQTKTSVTAEGRNVNPIYFPCYIQKEQDYKPCTTIEITINFREEAC